MDTSEDANQDPGEDTSTTISYLSDRGSAKDAIDSIIDDFESQSDYTVNANFTPKGTSLDEELQRMVSAGNPPDIMFRASVDIYRWARNGRLATLTDQVADLSVPDPVNIDGESYMIPSVVEPAMTWYRSDVYQTDPVTWDEWLEEAERVTNESGMKAMVIPNGQVSNAQWMMRQHLLQNDVNVFSGPPDDIQVVVDEGENRERCVELYQWIMDMYPYSPQANGWEWGETSNALIQENAAGAFSLSGLPMLSVLANRPDLATNFKPSLYPLPDGAEHDQWVSALEGHAVLSDGDATNGAREFVKFFNESDGFMDFVTGEPLFQWPAVKSQLDSDAIQNNETYQQFPEAINMVRDNWDNLVTTYNNADGGEPNIVAADAYNELLYGQPIEQMTVGGRSPSEAVDWFASELRALQN